MIQYFYPEYGWELPDELTLILSPEEWEQVEAARRVIEEHGFLSVQFKTSEPEEELHEYCSFHYTGLIVYKNSIHYQLNSDWDGRNEWQYEITKIEDYNDDN